MECDYLPTCLIPSEVCKSGGEPTVYLMQGQLLLRRLNHRLHHQQRSKTSVKKSVNNVTRGQLGPCRTLGTSFGTLWASFSAVWATFEAVLVKYPTFRPLFQQIGLNILLLATFSADWAKYSTFSPIFQLFRLNILLFGQLLSSFG